MEEDTLSTFFYYIQARNVEAVRVMLARHPALAYAANDDTDTGYNFQLLPNE